MRTTGSQLARRLLRTAVGERTYTVRRGIARGLKRKGGFSFVPGWLRPESPEHQFLISLDLAGKTVYDVGAFEGVHTLFFARATGPTGCVVSFEPSPPSYERLVENLALNGLTVRALPVALGADEGHGDLHSLATNPGENTFLPHTPQANDAHATQVAVPIARLDRIARDEGLPPPDLIKIDVEGYEEQVVRGGLDLLREHRPDLVIELHGDTPHERIALNRGYIALLRDLGYSPYHIESRRQLEVTGSGIDLRGHLYFRPGDQPPPPRRGTPVAEQSVPSGNVREAPGATDDGLQVAYETTLDEIASEWEGLAERVGAHPFVRPGWIKAWFIAFAPSAPEIVTVRAGDTLVGVCPLRRVRAATTSPTNWHSPRFGLVAENSDVRATIARALVRGRRVGLQFLDDGSEQQIQAAAIAAGYATDVRATAPSPVVAVQGSWEEYFAGRVSRNLRSAVRRALARLDQAGDWEFDVVTTSSRLDEHLEAGFAVEAAAWKGVEGTAINSKASTSTFYREIASWAVGRGMLRLCFLRLKGRPIAFDFCLESGGRFYSLKPGYDPEHRDLSPGRLMQRLQLERAFASGLVVFDFGGSPDHHKMQWGATLEPRVHVDAYAPTVGGHIERLARVHGRPLVKRARAELRAVRAKRSGRTPSSPA